MGTDSPRSSFTLSGYRRSTLITTSSTSTTSHSRASSRSSLIVNNAASSRLHMFDAVWVDPKKQRVTAPPTLSTIATVPRHYPPTGIVETIPRLELVMNAPFEDQQFYKLKLQNRSGRAVGFTIKPTNLKRITVHPQNGCLGQKEEIIITVGCEPFRIGKDVRNDLLILEWVSTPDGASSTFRRVWLNEGDGRRKNIKISYNF